MDEVHYMISEAAKRISVETHVLRYWEEELELTIGRTEMGHRYYTEDNIRLFRCIKELKEQGMFLKDLKTMIPDLLRIKEQKSAELMQEIMVAEPPEIIVAEPTESEEIPDNKLEQVQALFGQVLQDIISENNKVLEESVTKSVSEKVIKEMDFLLQAKEREEEERFKKLDSLIRQQQTLRRESAKSSTKKLRRLLGANEY